MNRHTANLTTLSAVIALLAAPMGAHAEAAGSGFHLRLAPLILEGNYFDENTSSSKFQEYRDLSSGLRVRLLSLNGVTDDLRRQFDFQVVNGGKRDAFYGMSYDVAGSWRLDLTYDMIPHRFGNDGHLLYTRTAAGRWEIADPVQQALQGFTTANQATLNFGVLNSALAPYLATANSYDIGLERRRSGLTLRLGDLGAGQWVLDVRHENRNGLRPFGTAFGFNNVTETAEPIDYDTTDATLSGIWKWSRGLMTAGYKSSRFDNNVSTLTWDNPFRITDSTDSRAYIAPSSSSVNGPSHGIFDLAADNKADTLFAHGRFDVNASSWLNVAASWTKYRQNDNLLPYTVNTAIDTASGAPFAAADIANLPYRSANRKSKLTNVKLDYGARFGEGWQAGLSFTRLDYSDDSPRYEFPGYVRFDGVWEDVARITVPYGWTKSTLSGNLEKDLGHLGTLGLEARHETWDRDFRETTKTTEDIVGVNWNARVASSLVRAKYEHGSRDFSGSYRSEAAEDTFVETEALGILPDLRRFDQAERTSDRWKLSVTRPFAEVWTIGVHVAGDKFDYSKSEFGLTKDDGVRYGFDLNWEAGAGSSFFLFGERSDRDVSEAGRQSGATLSISPLDNWSADFKEINDTWGLGWSHDRKRCHTRLTGSWEKSDGTADLFSPPGGTPDTATGFGNYEDYERWSFEGTFDYDVTANLAFGARVLYEDYTIDSFIRQALDNYLPGALLLNANDGNYNGWSAGVRMKVTL